VSQSAPLEDCTMSIHKCHLIFINMWTIRLWVFPSGMVQVYLWMFQCGNILHFTTRFFEVARFTALTPLSSSSLFSCKPSFQIADLKISSLPTCTLQSLYWNYTWYLGRWLNNCSNSSQKLSFESSPSSSTSICTFRTIISHQQPLNIMWHSMTNKLYSLNYW